MQNKKIYYPLLIAGWIFLGISASIHLAGENASFQSGDIFNGYSILCYSLSLFYAIWLGIFFFSGAMKDIDKKGPVAILLLLFQSSAFAFNGEIGIFRPSAPWLEAWLVFQSLVLILYGVRSRLPGWFSWFFAFTAGTGAVLYLYFSIFMIPLIPFAIFGLILFGIGMHVLAPVLLLIFSVNMVISETKKNSKRIIAFAAGSSIPLFVLFAFLFLWHNHILQIRQIRRDIAAGNSDLPAWTELARNFSFGTIESKFIRTGVFYDDTDFFSGSLFQRRRTGSVHDPIVKIASVINNRYNLDPEEKSKLLFMEKEHYNLREERLWSGDNLEIGELNTSVRLWPEYRLAYTEHTITIENDGNSSWANTQEAIFTFHLPEGATVTSSSLWVNGIEQPSRLTTPGKADSAYKAIVGVERRDPSVIKWQEGNTVSIRVFPCTPTEPRIFRIGITSPLELTGEKLVYRNPYFDGPYSRDANHNVQVIFEGAVSNPRFSIPLRSDRSDGFSYTGKYHKSWNIMLEAIPLSQNGFTFLDQSYSVMEYGSVNEPVNFKRIYLDINKTWTKSQIKSMAGMAEGKELYLCGSGCKKVKAEDLVEAAGKESRKLFSVFPFYEVKDPETALIITGGNGTGPLHRDLKGSRYHQKMNDIISSGSVYRVFDIGTELSPVMKTLTDFRLVNVMRGDTDLLHRVLSENVFSRWPENENTVYIRPANILVKKEASSAGNAPDHLMRIFAFNRVLSEIKSSYFSNTVPVQRLTGIAEEAWFVSPVSSLVVLESLADYERFDIGEAKKHSLQNASGSNSGAVPEPHEWLLILMILLTTLYATWKKGMLRVRF